MCLELRRGCEAGCRELGVSCSRTALFHLVLQALLRRINACILVFEICELGIALAFVALLPVALSAQAAKSTGKAAPGDNPSKWDIFMGYSYLAPQRNSHHIRLQRAPPYRPTTMPSILADSFSGAYYFNRYFGVQGEFGVHEWGDQSPNGSNIGTHGNDDGFMTIRRRPDRALSQREHHALRPRPGRRGAGRWPVPPALQVGSGSDGRRRYGLRNAVLQPSSRHPSLPGRLRVHARRLWPGHLTAVAPISMPRG